MEKDLAKLRFVGTSKGTACVGHICDECIFNGGRYSLFGKNPECCCFDETEKCLGHMPNYFFLKKDESNVVLFSKFRVPFDIPKSKKELFNGLKTAIINGIKDMQPKQDCLLQARYGSTEKNSYYDIENILFYNIGTAHFNGLASRDVVFTAVNRNEIVDLRKKFNIPDEYAHYYEYKLVSSGADKKIGGLLADINSVSIKCIGVKPATVWKALREQKEKIGVFDRIETDKSDTFAIVLNIEKPKGVRFNIMTAMKPLLDGLICALHSSEFNEEELAYFSQTLGCEEELFIDNAISVLGYRKNKFLQEYRGNVKWNPADDLCDYVAINVQDGLTWNVRAKVYSTLKCPYCGKSKLSKLLFGMPIMSDELQKDIEEGKVKLAGCIVGEDNPRYYCRWCKKEF
ncbi:MAG: hypothetical protein E7360_04250 [Clostridiales bacterium]|nr:hypothetical protein [Clostridiales bacterium]